MFRRMMPIVMVLVAGLVVGCGGGGGEGGKAVSAKALTTLADDASVADVGAFVQGDWTITLLADAGELQRPTVPAVWTYAGTTLEGTVAGKGMTNGRAFDGPPRVAFETPGVPVTIAGETFESPGPIQWRGTIGDDGTIRGTATGPDGRSNAWSAQR